jgi:hypothetical protein
MISQLGMQKRNGEQARFEYTEILIPSGYDTDIPFTREPRNGTRISI